MVSMPIGRGRKVFMMSPMICVRAPIPFQRADVDRQPAVLVVGSRGAGVSQGSHAEQVRSFGLGEAAPYSVGFSNS